MNTLKKAGVGTPAETQNQLDESYRNDNRLSNLKTQLGEFLLLLQTPLRPYERGACLQTLEKMLQEFYQLKGTQ